MFNVYKSEELFNCPHCGEQQEYPIDDYIVPNRTGSKTYANEECHSCYKMMHLVMLEKGIVRLSSTKSGLEIGSKKNTSEYKF